MAPLPIGMVIQTPTIPCAQRAHRSRLYLLQEQENMTSGAKLTPIERISGMARLWVGHPIMEGENEMAGGGTGRST
jgi:hypothetical protein